MKCWRPLLICALIAAWPTIAAARQSSITNSKHNLSASGPGAIRASSEQQICIFCHTPHNSSPIQPAWNRNVPANAYTVYTSNSLTAVPGQPTGSSKLCLSCHDGTIAVGSVLSRDQMIGMAGGITTLPPGASNLGTDLSDDHPVSFRYDSDLAAHNPKLRDPSQLPVQLKLDARSEMQCTTCHNAHDDQFGKFLVMSNTNSMLCKSCHNPGTTTIAAHDSCATCHTPHSAPSGPHLLKSATVTATCISCHGSQSATNRGPNIEADLQKISRHETTEALIANPLNPTSNAPTDVNCSSCHEGHTMQSGELPGAPVISPKLGKVSGVNAAGAKIAVSQNQFEVCFKCHADETALQPAVPRQIVQNNTRLEFAPAAVSYHPVQIAGKNQFVPSLRPGMTTASLIYCTDCHGSELGTSTTGNGSDGPHGSNFKPLLLARYETTDGTAESADAYALCYRCHERGSILGNASFTYHQLHIVNSNTPCSVCHDAHGISSAQGNMVNNSKLMNFDTSVVTPDPVTGRLEYRSLGQASGQCYLSCHGVAHSPLGYPGLGLQQVAPLNRGAVRPPPVKSPRLTPPKPTADPRKRP